MKYYNLIFFYNNKIKVFNQNEDIFDASVLDYLYFTLKNSKFDIIIFGCGKNLKKMPINLNKFLIEQKYNFEIMNTISAYNTHNVLLSERRKLLSIIKLA